ncbi:choline transporter [Rhizoctonia solani]
MSLSPRESRSSEDKSKPPEKIHSIVTRVAPTDTESDVDARKLVEMGYQPQLRRNFSIWSILGVGFSVTNSWWGISAGLVAGVNSGGPVLVIYGIILIATISTGVGISLAELASAMPNSGGQYYWTAQLAPRKCAPILSFLTGAVGWAGAVFTSASVCLSLGSSLVGMYALGHPDMIIQPWMVSAASLYISLISCFVITIAVPAASRTKQSAKFVFATFVNETGWENNVIAFIVGLINPNWSFACLDVATHMAEEIHQPERMIPLSILATVGIGLVSSLGYSIAVFFSMSDLEKITGTPTGVPILELYHQATRSVAGAIILQVLIVLTGLGCLTACHTWQARLAWSFARDRGVHVLLPSLKTTVFYNSVSQTIRSTMKSFTSIIVFSAALVGFVAAKPAVETRDSCKGNQFWYAKLGCCLDHGGPSAPPTPPRSRDCPKDNWYWNTKQGCCTPRHEDPPEPTCKRGFSWSKGSWCCEEDPTPTTGNSTPSQTPPGGSYGGGNNGGYNGGYNGGNNGGYNGGNNGGYNGGNHGWKAKRHNRIVERCPSKKTECPIIGAKSLNKSSDYECVDTYQDIKHCGGCSSLGEGQDCTAVAHSWNVGCEAGACKLYTCKPGYTVSKEDGKTCIKS